MALRYKISGAILLVLAISLVSLGFVVSHDAPCETGAPPPVDSKLMKAIVYRCYGSPAVLRFEDIAKPTPADNEVLVKVRAAGLNPFDSHYMRGTPYIVRTDSGFGKPDRPRLGVDFSGTVEAVGKDVQRFRPGDEVYGGRFGAFAEYVVVREDRALLPKPANVTFEQAASVPMAALTALQALRDTGKVRPGQKVLINGASGGVGTFAVQIAKSFGAEVTGVCSTRNVAMVKSLGADHVIDYTREDVTAGSERYDLILDNVGNHSLREYRRVLTPKGTFVIVGSQDKGRWLGPMMAPINAMVLSPFVSQTFVMVLADMNPQDLTVVSDLMQAGKVTPAIDRQYKLNELPAAMAYLEEGHARGKVVINIE